MLILSQYYLKTCQKLLRLKSSNVSFFIKQIFCTHFLLPPIIIIFYYIFLVYLQMCVVGSVL